MPSNINAKQKLLQMLERQGPLRFQRTWQEEEQTLSWAEGRQKKPLSLKRTRGKKNMKGSLVQEAFILLAPSAMSLGV